MEISQNEHTSELFRDFQLTNPVWTLLQSLDLRGQGTKTPTFTFLSDQCMVYLPTMSPQNNEK